jgi:hypothetical protein
MIMPTIEYLLKKLDEIPKSDNDLAITPNEVETSNIKITASVTSVAVNLITD